MFVAAALIAASFDADMSQQEIKETGIEKLSSNEKLALGSWLDARYSKKKLAAASNAGPVLEENLKSGHFIRLSDKSLWEIKPSDTPLTQGWITPVEIKVAQDSGNPDYPYTLTNTLTGSSVKARKAKTTDERPAPAQAAPKNKS